jgi:hypothetical protein
VFAYAQITNNTLLYSKTGKTIFIEMAERWKSLLVDSTVWIPIVKHDIIKQLYSEVVRLDNDALIKALGKRRN